MSSLKIRPVSVAVGVAGFIASAGYLAEHKVVLSALGVCLGITCAAATWKTRPALLLQPRKAWRQARPHMALGAFVVLVGIAVSLSSWPSALTMIIAGVSIAMLGTKERDS